jgi:uncharacterized protein (TIGR03000 family)
MFRNRVNLFAAVVLSAAALAWIAAPLTAAQRGGSRGGGNHVSAGSVHSGYSHAATYAPQGRYYGGNAYHYGGGNAYHYGYRPGYYNNSYYAGNYYRGYNRLGYYGGYGYPYYSSYYPYNYGWNYYPGYNSWWFPTYYVQPSYSVIESTPTVVDNYSPAAVSYAPMTETAQDSCAHLRVIVPPTAEVWVQGRKTSMTGSNRSFVSPTLTPGKDYHYDISVRWSENGTPVRRDRTIDVHANEAVTVNFMQ